MVHNDDNITTTSNHNNNATTTAAVEEAMQSIVNVNTDKLQSQRERYVNIEKEYYWKCTPTIISTADNNDDVSSPSTLMESSSSSRRLAPQDPAMQSRMRDCPRRHSVLKRVQHHH